MVLADYKLVKQAVAVVVADITAVAVAHILHQHMVVAEVVVTYILPKFLILLPIQAGKKKQQIVAMHLEVQPVTEVMD